jgi:hypothetical protein
MVGEEGGAIALTGSRQQGLEEVEHSLGFVARRHHVLKALGIGIVFLLARVTKRQQGIGDPGYIAPNPPSVRQAEEDRESGLPFRLLTGTMSPVLLANVGQLVSRDRGQLVLGLEAIVEAGEDEEISPGQSEGVDLLALDQVEAIVPRPSLLWRECCQEALPGLFDPSGPGVAENRVLSHHLCRRLIPQPDLILNRGREDVGAKGEGGDNSERRNGEQSAHQTAPQA